MKLNVLNLSLCRVPAFSIHDKLADVWPQLKEKIKTSSPAFYAQISAIETDQLNTLSNKIQYTLWKYFNRAKYRATPFANFASYSVVSLQDQKTEVKIEADMLSHKFTNWTEKDANEKNQSSNYNLLYGNTSAYYTSSEIRYLRFNEDTFELASVEIFQELKSLMQYCRTKRTKYAVFDFMKSEHQLESKQCKELIAQLLQVQLLQTDKHANITGEDYFKRLKMPHNDEKEGYILAERRLLAGGLDRSKTEEIAEAIQFISQHLPKSKNTNLENFKNAFLSKFEHQEVSLAIIMDPELGIGYGNLAQYEQTDTLIEQLSQTLRSQINPQSIEYTALHRFLMDGLMTNEPIALEKFNAAPLNTSPLPNTLSVLSHFYKNQPIISHAGGCTANALLGRFTLASAALEANCKEIAELEQKANPNVLFFDIPYQAETTIDNVNRRKSCYPYELPILNWSCQANPLDFNDVMVSVKRDEIVLRSKSLGKRLMPRLASAYNYSRSDLAVYRFLCDLQHQSIQSNLTFNFQTFLPDLNQYPRVCYKNVILSPAKWLIPKSLYQQKTNEADRILKDLRTWLKENGINFFIKTGHSDQTLSFDPNSLEDLTALLSYCEQQGDGPVYLSEALIDEDTTITDQNGKKYTAEFVINYFHNQKIYSEISQPIPLSVTPSIYLPASEWLYFEIFVHPSKSNDLLRLQINHLLKEHKNDIMKWFFIRYDENGKHLRLRLQVKDLTKRSCIIDNLNTILTEPLANGVVNDIALKPYRPELARYGALRIKDVEHFFYLDSKQVLSFLTKMPDKNECYHRATHFMFRISCVCFPTLCDRLVFFKQLAEAFSAEFKINQDGFKKINQAYIQLKNDEEQFYGFKQLENQAQVIFTPCNQTEKSKMLADLIHMHVNRMFNDQQRLHEAICYQFSYKRLLTANARLNAQGERQASA